MVGGLQTWWGEPGVEAEVNGNGGGLTIAARPQSTL
jgi:hypothetical protein